MENASQKVAETADTACIGCGGRSHKLYAVKNSYKVWKCQQCGMMFLHPLPKKEESSAVYSQDYFGGATKGHGYVDYEADKKAMVSVFRRHLAHFENILGKAGKLFDVGAATGFFMRLARERGWESYGTDISEYASLIGRKHGLDVATGTIHDVHMTAGSIDLITMWDVIEHVPDPAADLRKANFLLRQGGLLAINTPDAGSFYSKIMGSRWHLFVPPEHIWYFTRNSIRQILQKNGFEVLEIGCIGKRFTLEYFFDFGYRWQKLAIWKHIADYLRTRPLGRLAIPVNLRDNMYVLARKK